MIKEIFSTIYLEKENLLDKKTLEVLYNFVLMNGKKETIVTSKELPELEILRKKIHKEAENLVKSYNFQTLEVSKRFSTHFYSPNENGEMETHSDDLGDYGRKFISFFYLEAEEVQGGELELFDPRWLNSCWRDLNSSIKIQPKTNKLIVFPTFLWHRVNTYYSKNLPRMALDAVIRIT
jgi:Rps23 Pro-64 3,4-dihydroxylase Tpa1-like proline 4-hydroxylase